MVTMLASMGAMLTCLERDADVSGARPLQQERARRCGARRGSTLPSLIVSRCCSSFLIFVMDVGLCVRVVVVLALVANLCRVMSGLSN
eukprot:817023-Rhodomonas_salina.2